MTGAQHTFGPHREFHWSDEAVEKLKADWDSGLSGSQIGLRLGISCSAVFGKAHRLGLPERNSGHAVLTDEQKLARRAQWARHRNAQKRARRDALLGPRPERAPKEVKPPRTKGRPLAQAPTGPFFEPVPLPEPILDVPPHQRVRLVDLRHGQCRFFCGEVGQPDAGFCPAAALKDKSWCGPHYRITHAGPRQPYRPPQAGRIVSGMLG